jgi:hypothetical protein
MTSEAQACSRTLGEEESIWFKISPFINADEPITILMRLSDRYGDCIPANCFGAHAGIHKACPITLKGLHDRKGVELVI